MSSKGLPHHEEYEQGILGAIIEKPDLYEQVSATLNFTDFYIEKHRIIFHTMGIMRKQNIPIELITLRDALEESGKLEEIGHSSYLTFLTEMSDYAVNLPYYVKVIKDSSRQHDLKLAFYEGAQAVDGNRGEEAIAKIINKLSTLIQKPSTSTLKPVSARDLENMQPPVSYWADIIYPGCLIQLNAEPGIGKSTLAYNICALGAIGRPFLDIEFSRPIKSLYIDLETPRQLRPNKIRLIAGELPENFHILDALDLKRDYKELLVLCKEEKYDLVVLDTQSRVLAMEQENDNSEANHMAKLLRCIANEAGCAILLIHHSTKGEGGKAVYRGRGASAIAGAVDVVLNMQSICEDTLKLSVDKHRLQGSRPDLLIRKTGEDRFEPATKDGNGESLEETGFEIFTVQKRILETLKESDKPMRTKDIVQDALYELNVNRRMVERALHGLSQAGKVHKVKHGYYSIYGEPFSDIPPTPPDLYPNGNGGTAEPATVIPAHEPESHPLPLELECFNSNDPEELYENTMKRIEDICPKGLYTYMEESLPGLNKELKICEERVNNCFIEETTLEQLRAALTDYWGVHMRAVEGFVG